MNRSRLRQTIVFHALSAGHLKLIVEIQPEQVRHRLAERHITLQLTDGAEQYLADTGYDPFYGARPLKRAI